MDGKCTKEGVLSELRTEVKLIWERISMMDKMYESVNKLSESTVVLAEQMKNTNLEIQEIKKDVKEIKDIPTQNYNSYKNTIINTILGGMIGYLIAQMFL